MRIYTYIYVYIILADFGIEIFVDFKVENFDEYEFIVWTEVLTSMWALPR